MVAEEMKTAPFAKVSGSAVGAKQNGLGLGGIDDHADDDVGSPWQLSAGVSARPCCRR